MSGESRTSRIKRFLVSIPIETILVCVVMLITLSACSINKAYVVADKATFEAIAGEYVAYVASDARLTEAQKKRRVETVRSWEARLSRSSNEPIEPPPKGDTLIGPEEPLEAPR